MRKPVYAGTVNCLNCIHLQKSNGYVYSYVRCSNIAKVKPSVFYECAKTYNNIRKLLRVCRYYQPDNNYTLRIKEDGCMELDSIPTVPQKLSRVDFKHLPDVIIMKAVREEMREPTVVDGVRKTGGLVITFVTADNKELSQKYSKVSATVLVNALRKLKIKDTAELGNCFYKYALTNMEKGMPRYIPVAKASQAEIENACVMSEMPEL